MSLRGTRVTVDPSLPLARGPFMAQTLGAQMISGRTELLNSTRGRSTGQSNRAANNTGKLRRERAKTPVSPGTN